ncbi:alpha-2Da adrenergic receptor-like [Branchiostoma floridae]|uniref:Alpha-2Da adrenergic receptor-like n=1 Tax=Branchiostoma floridae TaxID=7739 RepID=A0A9J7M437_BRAFL|nr:alpha-2Da adrenergic receptor-like [Branchiostoma floridae]
MPPALVTELLGYWFFGEGLCAVFLAVDIFACTASINNLCAISLDRYWSVAHPADCRRQGLSRKRVKLAIVAVWVISAAICIPSLVGWTNDMFIDDQQLPQCEYTNNIGYVVFSTVGSFYLPLVIMTVAYVRVCWAIKDRILRNRRRKMPPLRNQKDRKAIADAVSGNVAHTEDENDSEDQHEETKQNGNPNALTMRGIPLDDTRRASGLQDRRPKVSGQRESQHGGPAWPWCCRRKGDSEKYTEGATTEHIKMHPLRSCAEDWKQEPNRPNNLLLSPVLLHRKSDLSISVSSPTPSTEPSSRRQSNHKKLEKGVSLPELSEAKTGRLQPVRTGRNTHSIVAIIHSAPPADSPNQHRTPNSKNLVTKKPKKQSLGVVKQRDLNKRIEIEVDLDDLTSTFSNVGNNDAIIRDEKELSKLHRLVNLRSPNALRKMLMRNRDRRLIVVVGIIMSVFVLCWLPFFLTYVVQTACSSCYVPETLFTFFVWLGYCNSSLNPILYTVFNRDFRKVFYQKILRRELPK